MIDFKQARAMRKIIEENSVNATDEQAAEAPYIFPAWAGGVTYGANDRVQYQGTAYKCLQAHLSQADWTPDAAVSLWAKILIPDPEVIPDWEQPDSTNPYMKGDKVRFEGKVYMSVIDNNVWSPAAYPAGWREMEG